MTFNSLFGPFRSIGYIQYILLCSSKGTETSHPNPRSTYPLFLNSRLGKNEIHLGMSPVYALSPQPPETSHTEGKNLLQEDRSGPQALVSTLFLKFSSYIYLPVHGEQHCLLCIQFFSGSLLIHPTILVLGAGYDFLMSHSRACARPQ